MLVTFKGTYLALLLPHSNLFNIDPLLCPENEILFIDDVFNLTKPFSLDEIKLLPWLWTLIGTLVLTTFLLNSINKVARLFVEIYSGYLSGFMRGNLIFHI